jgi:hypothetical protein
MRKVYFICAAMLVLGTLTLLGGCGGGGGDDIAFDGPVTDVIGFQFTEDNMWDAALIGLEPFLLFYDLSKIIAAVIEEVERQNAPDNGSGQLDGVLCGGQGAASLSWTGVRDQGLVVLDLEDCILTDNPATGFISFSNTLYDDDFEGSESLTAQILMDLTIIEPLNDGTSDLNIHGDFLLQVDRESNGTTKLGFRYGGDLDPSALLELTEGTNQLQLGCFDVSVSFDPAASEGTFLLGDKSISLLFGVVVANKQLLTITGPGGFDTDLASLVFVDGLPVASGSIGIDYWGFLMSDGCAVVGVPDGVAQGGTANMTMRIGGSDPSRVILELFPDGFGRPASDPPLIIPWPIFIAD